MLNQTGGLQFYATPKDIISYSFLLGSTAELKINIVEDIYVCQIWKALSITLVPKERIWYTSILQNGRGIIYISTSNTIERM